MKKEMEINVINVRQKKPEPGFLSHTSFLVDNFLKATKQGGFLLLIWEVISFETGYCWLAGNFAGFNFSPAPLFIVSFREKAG